MCTYNVLTNRQSVPVDWAAFGSCAPGRWLMPHVMRDEEGVVVAVSAVRAAGFEERLDSGSPELTQFLNEQDAANSLDATDKDFVRVLEDVVELLIAKGVILFTDLPGSAQDKIMRRQRLRSEHAGKLDLIGED